MKIFKEIDKENLFSYIALTNLYKFVTKNRINRSSGIDRKYITKKDEWQLLRDEIKILKPRLVVMQSLEFDKPKYKKFLRKLISGDIKLIITPHPSYYGTQVPNEYVKLFKTIRKNKV